MAGGKARPALCGEKPSLFLASSFAVPGVFPMEAPWPEAKSRQPRVGKKHRRSRRCPLPFLVSSLRKGRGQRRNGWLRVGEKLSPFPASSFPVPGIFLPRSRHLPHRGTGPIRPFPPRRPPFAPRVPNPRDSGRGGSSRSSPAGTGSFHAPARGFAAPGRPRSCSLPPAASVNPGASVIPAQTCRGTASPRCRRRRAGCRRWKPSACATTACAASRRPSPACRPSPTSTSAATSWPRCPPASAACRCACSSPATTACRGCPTPSAPSAGCGCWT
nr:uncharacterized protein LOC112983887 [Dromaius novaehollandiae]